jgi:hypothetical protein
MKNEAVETNNYEAICQIIREAKNLSDQRREELLHSIRYMPKSKRTILPEEKEKWFALHRHADKYHGAIGGHITKTECYTSLGTMTTYDCATCGEQAWIDEDF